MKAEKTTKITDITPNVRFITSDMQKAVYSRSFTMFLLCMLACMCVMGYGISQLYETQKDLQDLKDKYELNTLVRIKKNPN